jgi:hypothetical protein
MTWRLFKRSDLLSAAAAVLFGLIATFSLDTLAVDYAPLCPNHVYIKGVYTCVNFSADFQKNCQAAGQQSWILQVAVNSTDPTCKGVQGHAMNVVTAPSCDLASGLQRYCVVEPQNGQSWCWTQNANGNPSVPSWVMQAATTGMGAFSTCVAKGSYVYYVAQ